MLLAGCCKDAIIKRTDQPNEALRKKIRGILLDAAEAKVRTKEIEYFLSSCFEDPLIESVRKQCKSMPMYTTLEKEENEELKALAGKLS